MTTIHGWRPADVLPPVDKEGDSGFVLVLAHGHVGPIVAYFVDGSQSDGPRWTAPFHAPLKVRWWKPVDPIPASLFPPATGRWAIASGLAFDDSKESADG